MSFRIEQAAGALIVLFVPVALLASGTAMIIHPALGSAVRRCRISATG